VLLGSTYSTVALPTLASVCCVAPSTLCIAWLHLHWRVCVVWIHLHCVLRGSTYIGECVLCGSTYTVYCVAPPTLASVCCVAPPTLCIAWLHLHWRVPMCVQCAVAALILDEPFSGSTQKTQLRIVSELDTHDVLPGNPGTATILVRFRNHVDRKLNETIMMRGCKPRMNANISSWWTLDR